MEEPSVLDYVLSRVCVWKKNRVIVPSPFVEGEAAAPVAAAVEDAPQNAPEPANGEPAPLFSFDIDAIKNSPWQGAAAILLAVIGQRFLEPMTQQVGVALFFYAAALALLVWGLLANHVAPAALAPTEYRSGSNEFRRRGAWVGGALALAALLTFGGNQFTPINLTAWALSIGYLLYAFWQGSLTAWLRSLSQRLKNPAAWTVQLKGEWLMAVFVWAILLFFRFYRLDSLPSQMVSDHAEKLLDVWDVLHGNYSIFFMRNTGREAFQFYWTALMANMFGTGVSFMSLKIGTALAGIITMIYTYRLGKELSGPRVAWLALVLTGIGYWPNVISRIGLRFPLYPLFVAPALFYLLRGLRANRRNDFILAGITLGIGLQGYTAFRVMPLVVVAALVLYWLHSYKKIDWRNLLDHSLVMVLFALVLFLPLFRFSLEYPEQFMYRSLTRLAPVEQALPGSPAAIFFTNTWRAILMPFWRDGDVWVHSVTNRPALDVISAALFFIGLAVMVYRYIRTRDWRDLFLVLSVPLLMLSSILSLAFPNENPNLNRTAGAYVPILLIAAMGLDSVLNGLDRSRAGRAVGGVLVGCLLMFSGWLNFDLTFRQYSEQFNSLAWDTAEMGERIEKWEELTNYSGSAWVVAYPYWVDTRLVGINAGQPTWDTAIQQADLANTTQTDGPKLFLLNQQDQTSIDQLKSLYPNGWLQEVYSPYPGKSYYQFITPALDR